jgi:hypothetical protein
MITSAQPVAISGTDSYTWVQALYTANKASTYGEKISMDRQQSQHIAYKWDSAKQQAHADPLVHDARAGNMVRQTDLKASNPSPQPNHSHALCGGTKVLTTQRFERHWSESEHVSPLNSKPCREATRQQAEQVAAVLQCQHA